MDKLQGKKTYIVAALIGAATALKIVGLIDEAIYQGLLGFLGAAGLYAVRDGIKKTDGK